MLTNVRNDLLADRFADFTAAVTRIHAPQARNSVEDLIRTGRDLEAQVLAKAVRWVAEQRVLIDGRKTVVFR